MSLCRYHGVEPVANTIMNRTLRIFWILAALALMAGCNAFVEIEEEHPLSEEPLGLDETDQSCTEIVREAYPESFESDDSPVCHVDGEIDSECWLTHESCLAERDQITCEDTVELTENFIEGIDNTEVEFLELCLEVGESVDERLDDEACVRVARDCSHQLF